MRCLRRNMSDLWYALYENNAPLRDPVTGFLTGEYGVVYGNPVKVRANVSAARGESSTRQFGDMEGYDRTIALESTPIDEHSVLWIGCTPSVDANGALVVNEDGDVLTPHNYIVKKVAQSLNSVTLAVKKVNVGG